MDSSITSVETSHVLNESNAFVNVNSGDWANAPMGGNWCNDAVSSDCVSDASGLSDPNDFEIPRDIPDGPQFKDLAAHIDSVVASLPNTGNQNNPPASLDQVIKSQPPISFVETVDSGEPPVHVSSPMSNRSFECVESLTAENKRVQQSSSTTCDEQRAPESLTQSVPRPSSDIESNPSSDESSEQAADLQFPDVKPFAFFSTEDTSEMESDQWAWPQDEQPLSVHLSSSEHAPAKDFSTEEETLDMASKNVPSTEIESDEDFGEFEGCQATVTTEQVTFESHEAVHSSKQETSEHNSILGRLLQHLEPTLGKAFETSNSSMLNDWLIATRSDMAASPDKQIEQDHSTETLATSVCGGTTFWSRLFTQGRAYDARQQWSKSLLYDSYLRSVNVDMRSAMPAFASQLRLLEPVRLGTSTAQTNRVVTTFEKAVNSATSTASSNVSRSADPEFDWNSSGLTNPLGVNSVTEQQLDLDFFEVQSEAKSDNVPPPKNPKISELELELFAVIPQPPTSINHATTQPALKPTEFLFQSSTVSVPASKPATVSSTLRAVMAKLPKMRYMRARNLIFPVPETESN